MQALYKSLLTIFLVILTVHLWGQQPFCGTDHYMKELQKNFPQLLNAQQQGEVALKQMLSTTTFRKANMPLLVPVVFHVLYNSASQNIPDAQIYAQLDVLNKDFARLNADTTNTDSIFKPVASATNIRFCLATHTPQGAPTTGILRISYSGSFPSTPTVYSPEWDHLHYLNIYIGDLIPGMYGYSIVPPAPGAGSDHVVLDYETVGSTSSPGTMNGYKYGRIGTHEVAHWFGIRHTFNDSCSGVSADSCDLLGDYVCDTPPAAYPNFGCPFNLVNSCTELFPFPPPYSADMPDMYQNYTDYSYDVCRNLFTIGQATRMDAIVLLYRNQLQFASTACTPSDVNEYNELKEVSICPNPSSGNFKITLPAFLSGIKLSIFSMDGKLAYTTFVAGADAEQHTINLNSFTAGSYLLHIETNHHSVYKKIIVLQS